MGFAARVCQDALAGCHTARNLPVSKPRLGANLGGALFSSWPYDRR
jgi:hypothetical protein